MNQVRFRCPSGHKLKAPRHYAGRKAVCPACRTAVAIPAAEVTESGVARMLTVLNDESSADHRRAKPVATSAPVTMPAPEAAEEVSSLKLTACPQRRCDKCRKNIDESASVCKYCRTIQFPSGSRIRSLMQAASRNARR